MSAHEANAGVEPAPTQVRDRATRARSGRLPRLLRYRIDAISVAVVVGTFALQMSAWAGAWPWYACIPIIVAMRWSHLVQHNHAHVGIFHQSWLNEVLGWMMFFADGLPLEFYRIQHVQIHHRYNNREGDWTSPFAFRGTSFPDRSVGKLYFILTYPAISYCGSVVEVLHRPGSPALRRFLLSLAVVGGSCVVMAWLDFRSFALFFLLTWVVGWFGAAINNWNHHVGCQYEDDATSANVDLGFMCRGFGFNIGYHSAHHLRPAVHWSLLPELHERVMAPHIPLRYYRAGAPKHGVGGSREV